MSLQLLIEKQLEEERKLLVTWFHAGQLNPGRLHINQGGYQLEIQGKRYFVDVVGNNLMYNQHGHQPAQLSSDVDCVELQLQVDGQISKILLRDAEIFQLTKERIPNVQVFCAGINNYNFKTVSQEQSILLYFGFNQEEGDYLLHNFNFPKKIDIQAQVNNLMVVQQQLGIQLQEVLQNQIRSNQEHDEQSKQFQSSSKLLKDQSQQQNQILTQLVEFCKQETERRDQHVFQHDITNQLKALSEQYQQLKKVIEQQQHGRQEENLQNEKLQQDILVLQQKNGDIQTQLMGISQQQEQQQKIVVYLQEQQKIQVQQQEQQQMNLVQLQEQQKIQVQQQEQQQMNLVQLQEQQKIQVQQQEQQQMNLVQLQEQQQMIQVYLQEQQQKIQVQQQEQQQKIQVQGQASRLPTNHKILVPQINQQGGLFFSEDFGDGTQLSLELLVDPYRNSFVSFGVCDANVQPQDIGNKKSYGLNIPEGQFTINGSDMGQPFNHIYQQGDQITFIVQRKQLTVKINGVSGFPIRLLSTISRFRVYVICRTQEYALTECVQFIKE